MWCKLLFQNAQARLIYHLVKKGEAMNTVKDRSTEITSVSGDIESLSFEPIDSSIVIEGEPQDRSLISFERPDDGHVSGVWSATKGKLRLSDYPFTEFCYIVEGKVRLESSSGEVNEYRAGDAFIIPLGFEGKWETVEDVKKFYVYMGGK